MCYLIHVSTSSKEDFIQLPTDLYRFEHADEEHDDELLRLLKYPNRWFLSCRYGGCSCHYRHLDCVGGDPEFGPPEDWFPEDDDDIESTAAVYEVFARVIAEGHQLDVLDTWNAENLDSVKSLNVSLSQVPQESFRFLKNYRFELGP